MRLLLYHPQWDRSCADCSRWMFDDETGQVQRRPARIGLPIARIPGTIPPCHKCPKIPDDAPVKARPFAVEMSEQSRAAYQHYLECKAVGAFPPDPIVRRLAGLLRRIEDAYARNAVSGRLDAVISLLGLLTGGNRRG